MYSTIDSMTRLGLGCFPPAPGSVASSLARAEAAWLQGDRHAVAEATEGTLPLASERKWGSLTGELADCRRRAGLGRDIPAETAEPYVLQLAGQWTLAAKHWRELGCPYEAARPG